MVSLINTHEYTFSVDEFGEPIVLKNGEAIATVLARLLLLEPGTIQSHPEMGVGLVSKYRYSMEDNIKYLKEDFRNQIEKYLPQFQGVEVTAYLEKGVCYINATIDGVIYAFFYDVENDKLQSKFKKLNEL